jgi:hypothetical protein
MMKVVRMETRNLPDMARPVWFQGLWCDWKEHAEDVNDPKEILHMHSSSTVTLASGPWKLLLTVTHDVYR